MIANLLKFLVGILAVLIPACCVIAAIIIVSWWKIFEKAGDKGWKALIPVYNVFTWFNVAENGKSFWPFFFAAILDIAAITFSQTCAAFLEKYYYTLMVKILIVLFTVILLVLYVAQTYQLAKAFGKSVGFFFGLLLLPVVFYPILAFGPSEYAPQDDIVHPEKRSIGLKASRVISNIVIYIILVAMSIIWLIPFVFILLQSFRVESTWQVGYVLPKTWGFDNYIAEVNEGKGLKFSKGLKFYFQIILPILILFLVWQGLK